MSAPNTRTIRRVEISAHGGPEVMSVISTPLAGPAAHEVMVELSAVGVNLIDTYHRKGVYPISLPSGLGCEGAGRVVATGDAVTEFSMGDRVAFVMAMGSYAEAINLPATSLVKIPDGVSDDQAAAILLKAMTVDYLFNESFPLKGGETILFHAAAGGVGLVACQWAHHLGVRLIGTASTDEKMALARDNGAAECVSSVSKNLGEELRLLAPDAGFPVIYDSIGQATYSLSLSLLAPLGYFVSFGNASGAIESVSPGQLAAAGSVYFTRPTLATHIARPAWMARSAARVFELMRAGVLRAEIHQTYGLDEVVRMHQDLEARTTAGSLLVKP